jgi:hypothetical protein
MEESERCYSFISSRTPHETTYSDTTYPKCRESEYHDEEVKEVAKEHISVYVSGHARARRQHALEEPLRWTEVSFQAVIKQTVWLTRQSSG